jgi:hypothetical protein
MWGVAGGFCLDLIWYLLCSSALLLRLGWKSLTIGSLTTVNLFERLMLDGMMFAGEIMPPLFI